jgi:hypothetical protein
LATGLTSLASRLHILLIAGAHGKRHVLQGCETKLFFPHTILDYLLKVRKNLNIFGLLILRCFLIIIPQENYVLYQGEKSQTAW